jgi:hypothetical protein
MGFLDWLKGTPEYYDNVYGEDPRFGTPQGGIGSALAGDRMLAIGSALSGSRLGEGMGNLSKGLLAGRQHEQQQLAQIKQAEEAAEKLKYQRGLDRYDMEREKAADARATEVYERQLADRDQRGRLEEGQRMTDRLFVEHMTKPGGDPRFQGMTDRSQIEAIQAGDRDMERYEKKLGVDYDFRARANRDAIAFQEKERARLEAEARDKARRDNPMLDLIRDADGKPLPREVAQAILDLDAFVPVMEYDEKTGKGYPTGLYKMSPDPKLFGAVEKKVFATRALREEDPNALTPEDELSRQLATLIGPRLPEDDPTVKPGGGINTENDVQKAERRKEKLIESLGKQGLSDDDLQRAMYKVYKGDGPESEAARRELYTIIRQRYPAPMTFFDHLFTGAPTGVDSGGFTPGRY